MSTIYYETDFLMHHGVKGQKWGVRRYQNPDGTLTEAGKRRAIRQDKRKTYNALVETRDATYKLKRQNKQLERIKRKIEDSESKGNTTKVQKLTDKYNTKITKVDALFNNTAEKNVNTISEITARHGESLVDKWLKDAALNASFDYYYNGTIYAQWINKDRYAENLETANRLEEWASRKKR